MADSTWSICPDCHTIVLADATSCPHCRFDLQWVVEHQEFREALQEQALRPPQLHLVATWSAGSTEVFGNCDEPLELAVAGKATYRFRVQGPDWRLQAEGGSSDQLQHWPLPCRAELDGLHVTARLRSFVDPSWTPPKLDFYRADNIRIPERGPVTLGRAKLEDAPNHHEIDDADVEPQHCLLLRQPETGDLWMVDRCTSQGTFVNQRPLVVSRMRAGDVLQLGAFAWILNQADGFLIPVGPLQGASLEVRDVGLQDRLWPLSISVPSGQFIGIAGSSGEGKSTLMYALLGAPYSRDVGDVWVGGIHCDDRAAYRRQLGYVSQREVVLGDLPAVESIQFSGLLRNKPASPESLAQLLRQLDLPEELWRKQPGKMSGGEGQRVRIAAELVAWPPLLLMDEPAKGLDLAREIALMKRLRTLALQGCTVIVITHGLQHLEFFDRVLLFDKHREQGRLRFDGTPRQLKEAIPAGNLAELDFNNLPVRLPAVVPVKTEDPAPSPNVSDPLASAGPLTTDPARVPPGRPPLERSGQHVWQETWAQAKVLFRREMTLARCAPMRRLAIPLLVVPAIFAAALHLAVPSDQLHLLGFLSVVSCIWMGASLSLMSIVDERSVLDHECLLFLRLSAYIQAKWLALALLSALQTGIFVLLLGSLRLVGGGQMLHQPHVALLVLILVGWASMGLGLLISAFAGVRPIVANFLLPLVIMIQIVFSVQVATEHASQPLHVAYGEFSLHDCQGRSECPLRAVYRESHGGLWLCDRCSTRWRRLLALASESGSPPVVSDLRKQLDRELPALRRDEQSVVRYNRERPRMWSVVASWFTVSRYGDMALRGFAYDPEASLRWNKHGYGRWLRDGLLAILLQIVGFPVAAWLLLWAQTTGKTRPLERWLQRVARGLVANGLGLIVALTAQTADAQQSPLPPSTARVEIVLPLRDGRFYAREDLQRQLNEKLQTRYRVGESTTWIEFQRSDRLALQLAAAAGLLEIDSGPDRLRLRLKATAAARRRLESVFPVWGLVVPKQLDPVGRAALLVHGLESSPEAFGRWSSAFAVAETPVLVFDYPNDGSLETAARRLGSDLKSLRRRYPKLKLIVVAHSMGGLVVRSCLESPGRNPGSVRHLFMLGTPHQGSAIAGGQRYLEMIHRLIPGQRDAKWTTINDGQGEAALDLKPGSPFLQQLARGRKPAKTEYFGAVGTRGYMTPGEARRLAGQLDRVMTSRKTPAERRRAILAFARAEELQTGKGDGAVTVQSATLPAAQNRQFDLNHLQMLRLPGDDPARHPLFRWVLENSE